MLSFLGGAYAHRHAATRRSPLPRHRTARSAHLPAGGVRPRDPRRQPDVERRWPPTSPPRASVRLLPTFRWAHTRTRSPPTADQSPRGVARQVIAFLERLDLTDVTLVGNDTGGAICQYLLDTDASRIGRLVLTNCDCFDQFPPSSLQRFMEVMRRPAAIAGVAQAMRSTTFRHGRFGYGPFAREYDTVMTRAWIEPLRTDPRIREDVARFAAAVDASDLTAVGDAPAPVLRKRAARVGQRRSVLPDGARPSPRRRLP